MSVQLNREEQSLRAEIEVRVEKARQAFAKSHISDEVALWISEAGKKAHRLHLMLKNVVWSPSTTLT
ncbi:MAG: hypothetical protein WCO56_02165 [Verrucomicrobiota bacterium]